MARLRFHGPEDAVEVPGLTDPVLIGEEVDVSAELAGRATDGDGIGHGLLAQTFTDPTSGEVVPSWSVVDLAPVKAPTKAAPTVAVKEG